MKTLPRYDIWPQCFESIDGTGSELVKDFSVDGEWINVEDLRRWLTIDALDNGTTHQFLRLLEQLDSN